jgi:hypothetical protein
LTLTIARITADTDAALAQAQERAERAAGAEQAAVDELERVRAEATEHLVNSSTADEPTRSPPPSAPYGASPAVRPGSVAAYRRSSAPCPGPSR